MGVDVFAIGPLITLDLSVYRRLALLQFLKKFSAHGKMFMLYAVLTGLHIFIACMRTNTDHRYHLNNSEITWRNTIDVLKPA